MSEATVQAAVVIERRYKATIEELWSLWTTRDGFESWWGPEGFRVEASEWDARVDGGIVYDMIADSPEAIAAMKQMGQPLSHKTKGWFSELKPHTFLSLMHKIDFVPGQPHYETRIDVAFRQEGETAVMITTLHPHLDPEWSRMSLEGYTSQLTKLDKRYGL